MNMNVGKLALSMNNLLHKYNEKSYWNMRKIVLSTAGGAYSLS